MVSFEPTFLTEKPRARSPGPRFTDHVFEPEQLGAALGRHMEDFIGAEPARPVDILDTGDKERHAHGLEHVEIIGAGAGIGLDLLLARTWIERREVWEILTRDGEIWPLNTELVKSLAKSEMAPAG